MKVRTYLSWIIDIWGKGPSISLWISSRGVEVRPWLNLSYLCSRCFPRMHPWQTPLENLILGNPMTMYFSHKLDRYLYFRWTNLSFHILIASLAWVRRAEGFEKGMKCDNLYTLELWSTKHFAMNLPFEISMISTSSWEKMTFLETQCESSDIVTRD